MGSVELFLWVVLAIAVLAFVVTHRRSQRGSAAPRASRRTAGGFSRRPLSSSAMLERVTHLRATAALWPEVLSTLNPSGDAAVAALLERIRVPHVFNPGLALNVIEAGCRDVGMAASGLDALRAAAASTERVVGYGR
jgi:hypothetical protein